MRHVLNLPHSIISFIIDETITDGPTNRLNLQIYEDAYTLVPNKTDYRNEIAQIYHGSESSL